MLQRYTTAVVLVVALVVLVVEGFFVYRWYDRYYGYDAAAASEEPTGSPSAGPAGPAGQKTADGPGRDAGQEVGDADSGGSDGGITFTHTASDENSRGDYTYLSPPGIDAGPDAVLLVAVSRDGGSGGGVPYGHNTGVWYDFADKKKWAIFNQDRAAVPAGTVFEVVVPPASEGFVHRAELVNIVGNVTYLDNPLTNGKPDAVLSVTQNWNPGGGAGVYNDHPVDTFYDDDVQKWALYNKDGAPMPDGAAFNVALSGSAEPTR